MIKSKMRRISLLLVIKDLTLGKGEYYPFNKPSESEPGDD
jgi:hypothetical protein